MSYKRDPITDAETLKTLRISPSSINTYRKCPRRWFHEYILALQGPQTIALVRGNVVHYVLEEMFKQRFVPTGEAFRPHMMNKAQKLFDKKWNEDVPSLNLPKEEHDINYEESKYMIERFFKRFCDNVQDGIKARRYENETQGYYFTRPAFKELWIDDQFKLQFSDKWKSEKIAKEDREKLEDSLNVGGFIDSVQKDFDGNQMLIDYKTSNKYQNVLSDDYVLQLAIYAYLWQKQTGKLPTFVAINYLKYDETFYIMVTPSLIKDAIDKIKAMRNEIVEKKLEICEYPAKFSKLCDYCPFQKECGILETECAK